MKYLILVLCLGCTGCGAVLGVAIGALGHRDGGQQVAYDPNASLYVPPAPTPVVCTQVGGTVTCR